MQNFTHHKYRGVSRRCILITQAGFSLVEMLMTLLVASLLLAALAPVITKRVQDNVSIKGDVPAEKTKTHEINYNDDNCNTIDTVNNVCTGEFTVPSGYNGNMNVTITGGGGGVFETNNPNINPNKGGKGSPGRITLEWFE